MELKLKLLLMTDNLLQKQLGQRAMTIFAGPMMNFVLAFVIFLVIGLFQGIPSE